MTAITVYRSGQLTPYDQISNSSAKRFDALSMKLTQKSPNRCSSVYAGLNLDEVETVWAEYRETVVQMDWTIYKIVIPDRFLSEEIYAYNLEAYDEFWWNERREKENPHVAARKQEGNIRDYLSSRVHISDWEYTLSTLSMDELRHYEILIPHHIAEQCKWSVLTEEDRESWFDAHSQTLAYF